MMNQDASQSLHEEAEGQTGAAASNALMPIVRSLKTGSYFSPACLLDRVPTAADASLY